MEATFMDRGPHRPQHHKKVTIQNLQMDSSLESDYDLDTLNY